MGLYDTLIFNKALNYKKCNTKIDYAQTKNLSNTLSSYNEGDFINSFGVITGVIEENLFCRKCHNSEQKVYMAIWHYLYVGTYNNYDDANKRINSIEKTDLLDYILALQKELKRTRCKYNIFFNLVDQFSQYCINKKDFFNRTNFNYSKIKLKEYKKKNNKNDILKNIVEDFRNNSDLIIDKELDWI